MLVGYLVPEFPGQTHAFFWREIQALRAKGCEVDLISTREPASDACHHEFAGEARRQTRYLFPPSVGAAFRSLSFRLPLLVKQYLEEIPAPNLKARLKHRALLSAAFSLREFSRARSLEHIHVHSCANAAHVAALCHLLGGPPYSLTLHGDLNVYGDAHAQKFRHAKFVSVVTFALKRQVVDTLKLAPEFLPVIRMGVDTDRFLATAAPASSIIQAVTVARLNHTKGHLYALEAIADLRARGIQVNYQIVGAGPEEANIVAHIRRLDLSNQVQLLGSRSEDSVRELLVKSDVFILSSFGLGEAAPVSVMEAMASGRPVISTRIGGTAEMIDDERDGLLVAQQNSSEIAKCLEQLISDPELRSKLGAAAREKAVQEFDYRINAALLLDRIEA